MNDERSDNVKMLLKIATEIESLADDLGEDKYSQSRGEIIKKLNDCKNDLGIAINILER